MTSTIKREIGRRLADVRRRLDLSQAEFAAKLDVPMHTYRNWERGLRDVPLQIVENLNQNFRVDPLWLICGEAAARRRRSAMADYLFDAVEQADEADRESDGTSRSKFTRSVVKTFFESWDQAESARSAEGPVAKPAE